MRDFSWGSFWMGMAVCIWLVIGLEHFIPTSDLNKIKNAIELCEKSLPRDQECMIVGIPRPKE